MPQLDLTETELKACWLILDATLPEVVLPLGPLIEAERTLFDKVYRAYRGMPPERAA